MQDDFETLDDFLREATKDDPRLLEAIEDSYPEDRLGAELAMMRENRGLTQRELAAEAGISQSMFNRIERGNQTPKISTLWKILRALKARLVFDPVADELRVQPSAAVHTLIQGEKPGFAPSGFPSYIVQIPQPYPIFSTFGVVNVPGFTAQVDPFTASGLLDLWNMRVQINQPTQQPANASKIQNFPLVTQQGVA